MKIKNFYQILPFFELFSDSPELRIRYLPNDLARLDFWTAPSSISFYCCVYATSQLAHLELNKIPRNLVFRKFAQALLGLCRTANRKTNNKTSNFSAILRRIAAADFSAWRQLQFLRESSFEDEETANSIFDYAVSYEEAAIFYSRKTIYEDTQLAKLNIDLETLAQLALEENLRKYRDKRDRIKRRRKYGQIRLF